MSDKFRFKVRKSRIAHACPEWDYAWIEPGDVEFEACICTPCDGECCREARIYEC